MGTPNATLTIRLAVADDGVAVTFERAEKGIDRYAGAAGRAGSASGALDAALARLRSMLGAYIKDSDGAAKSTERNAVAMESAASRMGTAFKWIAGIVGTAAIAKIAKDTFDYNQELEGT